MKAAGRTSLYIDYAHVRDYNVPLADHIEAEYVKYVLKSLSNGKSLRELTKALMSCFWLNM
jgi:hypothetical protein